MREVGQAPDLSVVSSANPHPLEQTHCSDCPFLAPKRRLFEMADWSAYWGDADVLTQRRDDRCAPRRKLGFRKSERASSSSATSPRQRSAAWPDSSNRPTRITQPHPIPGWTVTTAAFVALRLSRCGIAWGQRPKLLPSQGRARASSSQVRFTNSIKGLL